MANQGNQHGPDGSHTDTDQQRSADSNGNAKAGNALQEASSWTEAAAILPDANLALFSTPGEYAAPEIERALDMGLHVFSFSDNIALEDEIRLKQKAHEKGLLFMGPDCGTGIQEVTAVIDRLGGGVVHAIGTGGRDLNEKVGAITVKDAIDPEVRIKKIRECAAQEDTGVILLDCMLGYGCHPDMAAALAPVICEPLEKAKAEGRELYFVGSVCGTEHDPQDYHKSVATLKECGVLVETSNARAIRLALELKGIHFTEADREVVPYTCQNTDPLPVPSDAIMELLNTKPRIINVGVESFNDSLRTFGGKSVQYNWKLMAGGNKRMIHLLNELAKHEEIDEMNMMVVERFRDAQSFLVDVVEKNVVSTLMKGGHVVITVGGGGIPVISKDGRLIGTPAVIDKDFASAKLAELICADMLVILTAVDRVAINWGKPTRSLWKRCPWPRPSSTAVRVISYPAACCPRWRLPCPLPASAVLPSSPAWKTQQQRCVARAAPAYTHKDQQNIPAFGQVRKIYFYRIFRQRNFGCAVFPYASYSFQNGNDVVNIM